ncbi:transposase [Burkholderiales bacterium GJ-E10]|nr:transposase [Burkholderiales bacterium GJ-E10]
MARLSRLSIPGFPHHVVQRAIDRRTAFLDEADFRAMLGDLADACDQEAVSVHAYVLMPDHFHLVCTPEGPSSLSRAMQAVGRRYVRRFNRRHARNGALWEGRFRCTVLDADDYLLDVMRYVETEPARSALLGDAAAYPWSSMAHHLGMRVDPLIRDAPRFWALGNTPFERQAAYGRLCAVPMDAERMQRIREATHHGWPLGSPQFVAGLAEKTSRRLTPMTPGRPRLREPGS